MVSVSVLDLSYNNTRYIYILYAWYRYHTDTGPDYTDTTTRPRFIQLPILIPTTIPIPILPYRYWYHYRYLVSYQWNTMYRDSMCRIAPFLSGGTPLQSIEEMQKQWFRRKNSSTDGDTERQIKETLTNVQTWILNNRKSESNYCSENIVQSLLR